LLCNIYLHRLDRVWDVGQHGVLVRYCDDLVVMCDTRQQAEAALERLRSVLGGLGLELKAAKTRIVRLTEGKDAGGFDFLGFHHRWVRAKGKVKPSRVCFLARWPSRKAAQHARDRIRQMTERKRLWVPDEQIVQDLNRFLRGWGGYFRYGNSAQVFDAISQYALERLAGFVAKRHKQSRRWGMRLVTCGSPGNLGLITLCGTVNAPRPFRPWRAPAERRR
jgi:RNA-directed DNA polymerase